MYEKGRDLVIEGVAVDNNLFHCLTGTENVT
jgi:hypothetical protein